MKYFDLSTVVDAYKSVCEKTESKFWGLLGILKTLPGCVEPCINYELKNNLIAGFLEDIFALTEEKKTYSISASWYAKFSNHWERTIGEQMFPQGKTPDILPVIVWAFRNYSFEDEFGTDELKKLFTENFNFRTEQLDNIFGHSSFEIKYADHKYTENELLAALKNYCVDNTDNTTITLEKKFIKASPGEFARAPFIQTLYSALGTMECLILTQIDLSDYYGDKKTDVKTLESTKQKDLSESLQLIFYGAPGTGKSYEVKKITGEPDGEKPNVFRTTFHPDTDYASFVGCYKPVMKEVKKSIVKPHEQGKLVVTEQCEEIAYEFVPQAFTDAYIYAYDHPEETTYLVIEEINRGNCAQIFGDLFQLLDRNDNGVSEYSIKADKDLAKYLADGKHADGSDVLTNKRAIKDGKLCLPANLHILATMNTSDQSLFPIDSAFKRRWDWEYVAISYTEPKSSAFKITIDNDHSYSWVDFIKEVNKRIYDLTQSEDKQMGNFFIKDSVDKKQFCSKVMFYLWNEVLKDEVDNSKYFFYEDKGSNQTSKFTFTDVYSNKETVILANFMEYLGVTNLSALTANVQAEGSSAEDNVQ